MLKKAVWVNYADYRQNEVLHFFVTPPAGKNGTLPLMTKITIPPATKTAFRIPAKPTQPEKQDIERIGVSAEVASEMLGVGVRTMWNLAKEQKVRTVRIGTRVVFSVQSLREFIDGKPEPADKSDIACVAEGKERNEWQH